MDFKVVWWRYNFEDKRLDFSATGKRGRSPFSIVTWVSCLKPPTSDDEVNLIARLKVIGILGDI
ncbi:MAG: hypothetical protein P0Y65_20780 [Candidatus Devosia phytovorans]|uniref:Uncharacterized protein n=1 Tax=Candidatus Devosia phytovorans TaxID=3121372 RepID=A0AAJ5VWA4_9HYPH|nr:hypothetical protein [Devosia sp.]WEK04578.1 MAG: hypothetical protein P0Y65_20780 [Devosia sp.]